MVLFGGGLLRLWGYPYIFPPLVRAAGVDAQLIGAVYAVWLSFAVQFVAASPVLVCLSRRAQGRYVISLLFLLPLVNAILMYRLVGPIIGSYTVSAGHRAGPARSMATSLSGTRLKGG
jgi:hypothetical protein